MSYYQEVGIDRAAAEWVLRCGGGITWTGGVEVENMSGTKYFETRSLLHFKLRDYNSLPVGKYRQLKVAGIDGTDR